MDNLVKVLTEYNSISAVVRLALALVCGGIIGLEREKSAARQGSEHISLYRWERR